jgi:amino acid transporter
VFSPLKRLLLGRPLPTSAAQHERLSRITGLAVLSSDALSSVAYATDAMLEVLVPAGLLAVSYTRPLAFLIASLLIIVTFSYRQTIYAYPQGGGAYIVAKDNLGIVPGLVAATALLIDYVLTVAVSVSAGISAIVSAAPSLDRYRVALAVGCIGLIAWGNLRGVRQSGRIFAVPTYAFISSVMLLLMAGLWRITTGHLPPSQELAGQHATATVGMFLLLRAFANGCTAMTGVEAISNGIPAFEKPEAKNAAATLLMMALILLTMFLGISVLSTAFHVAPRAQETILSQLGRAVFGARNIPYFALQVTTTFILILAANTSYADFPRLASLLARDRFAPIQFTHRGDRLVFSNGIALLTVMAIALVIAFDARELRLIPLYAVGVFLSFTLSQTGMVWHWRRHRERGWRWRAAMNALGAIATMGVLAVFIVAKFSEGAWIVVLLIPAGVWLLLAVARHYRVTGAALALPDHPHAGPRHHVVILIVPEMNRQIADMVAYGSTLSDDVRALHVDLDPDCTKNIQQRWPRWGQGTQLTVLKSPYRSLVEPLLAYLETVDQERSGQTVTVLIPELRPRHWWQTLLHKHWSVQLRSELEDQSHVRVIASFEWPFQT